MRVCVAAAFCDTVLLTNKIGKNLRHGKCVL